MKVLNIVGNYPTEQDPQSGIFIKSQIESLKDKGINVDVFVLKGKGIKKYFSGIFRLRRHLKIHRYDIFHAHYMYCGWTARFAVFNKPLIVSFMGSDVYGKVDVKGEKRFLSAVIHKQFSRLLARLVTFTIVKSQKLSEIINVRSMEVIPNGVDLDLFKPFKVKFEDLNLCEEKKYILFGGNPWYPEKRYFLAKKAVYFLREKIFNSELLYLSNSDQKTVAEYMNAVDCLLLTSSEEGSPNIIKEAMACNLPVVSVDVGDAGERLCGADNCYVVKSDDPAEISDSLFKVLNSGKRSDNSRDIVSLISIDKIADKLKSVYLELYLCLNPKI